MIRVRNVADINPPITTVASGFWTSAPAELDNAIGKNPREATAAVIITGRNRVCKPLITRSVISVIPSFSSLLNSAISTMPLSTATPNRAIKPTPAEMEKFIPLNHNANTPPIADIGTAEKIRKVCTTELNVKNSSTKISSNATGTAIASLVFAASRFWNCPPKVTK